MRTQDRLGTLLVSAGTLAVVLAVIGAVTVR